MAEESLAPDDRPVLTVSEVNRRVRQLLEDQPDLRQIWVRGEVSNYRGPHHGSGHLYFRLKDEDAEIDCVMWRGQARGLQFEPEDGMEVLAKASVGLWEKAGKYQIYVSEMLEAGQGDLYLRYQMLKKRLGEEGLFDESRKRPLPEFTRTVGIVTSKGAAALQDALNVLRRRSPHVHVVIADAKVQGEGAAETVADAIARLGRWADAGNRLDVIIVTRGGGSMEDLWAFNEEVAVRAVARSRVPVVSGVGHETDWTLVDLAADVRAPTPSAAAEVAAQSREETLTMLSDKERELAARLDHQLQVYRHRLDGLATRPVLSRPEALLRQAWQRTDDLADRLPRAARTRLDHARSRLEALSRSPVFRRPEALMDPARTRVDELERRLPRAAELVLERGHNRLGERASTLDALSPLKVLGRGFAAAQKEGQLVRSIQDVAPGDRLDIRVEDGTIATDVQETEEASP